MVKVAAVLMCKCIVVSVVRLVVVVVACIGLLILLVDAVAVVIDIVARRLVCCTSIFAVVVVVVVVVFLDCDDFSLLCAGLFCFVGCCFFVVSFGEVACLVLVLDFVGLAV